MNFETNIPLGDVDNFAIFCLKKIFPELNTYQAEFLVITFEFNNIVKCIQKYSNIKHHNIDNETQKIINYQLSICDLFGIKNKLINELINKELSIYKNQSSYKTKLKKNITKIEKLGDLIEKLNNNFYKDLNLLHKKYILEISRIKRTKGLKIKHNVENVTNLFNKKRGSIIEEYKNNINVLSNTKKISTLERKLKTTKAKKVIKNLIYYFRK